MGETAVHVIITGRVQGVWFRGWTKQEARARNLTGWVRNRRDGSVEAVFQGTRQETDEMLARCRIGPPAANVTEIQISPIDAEVFSDFRNLPTA